LPRGKRGDKEKESAASAKLPRALKLISAMNQLGKVIAEGKGGLEAGRAAIDGFT
jgi:hypothetical protein